MTASWHTLLDVAIRTSVVYLALLVGLRVTGKRQLGQMSTFDFVLLLGGTADLLVYHGRVFHQHLERENLTVDELRQALREHGVASLDVVHMAVLEPDGAISVIRSDEIEPGRPHHRIKAVRRNQ